MLTNTIIKQKAKELGATVCGIGKIYSEPDLQRDPRCILPNAKSIIGFGFAVPKGLWKEAVNIIPIQQWALNILMKNSQKFSF